MSNHASTTIAKAIREIKSAYQSITVTLKAPLSKAKAESSCILCPVLVVEEYAPKISNNVYFNRLVGSLGGLNMRWNSYHCSVDDSRIWANTYVENITSRYRHRMDHTT